MAGTRLLVHVSFLFGMLSVAALAVFMALRPGPSPLLPDRSGWAEAARVGKRLERLAAMLEEEAGGGEGAGPHPLLPPLLTSGPRCAVTVAALDEDPATRATRGPMPLYRARRPPEAMMSREHAHVDLNLCDSSPCACAITAARRESSRGS